MELVSSTGTVFLLLNARSAGKGKGWETREICGAIFQLFDVLPAAEEKENEMQRALNPAVASINFPRFSSISCQSVAYYCRQIERVAAVVVVCRLPPFSHSGSKRKTSEPAVKNIYF